MLEIENNYLHIWVDEAISLLYSEWKRVATSAEYREGNGLLLKLVKENNIQNWIADSEKLGDISAEDELWSLHEFMPLIIDTRLVKVARVGGKDTGSQARFEQFVKRVDPVYIGHIQVRQFTSYKEAADWIGEVPV